RSIASLIVSSRPLCTLTTYHFLLLAGAWASAAFPFPSGDAGGADSASGFASTSLGAVFELGRECAGPGEFVSSGFGFAVFSPCSDISGNLPSLAAHRVLSLDVTTHPVLPAPARSFQESESLECTCCSKPSTRPDPPQTRTA